MCYSTSLLSVYESFYLLKYKNEFANIRKFWNVNEEECIKYCQNIQTDDLHLGAFLCNFYYADPKFESIYLNKGKYSSDEKLSVVAHEFSHAMYNASHAKSLFENISQRFPYHNSHLACKYLNEAIAIVFEHIFLKSDKISATSAKNQYASGLYRLVKNYFENAKSIDETFVISAIKIFDEMFPTGYRSPNLCLYDLLIIHPDASNQKKLNEIIEQLRSRTDIERIRVANLSQLYDLQNYSSTAVLIFYHDTNQLQLFNTKNISADIDIKIQNHRALIFIKIDKTKSINKITKLFTDFA